MHQGLQYLKEYPFPTLMEANNITSNLDFIWNFILEMLNDLKQENIMLVKKLKNIMHSKDLFFTNGFSNVFAAVRRVPGGGNLGLLL